jgi:hypothetical protein
MHRSDKKSADDIVSITIMLDSNLSRLGSRCDFGLDNSFPF